MSFTLSLNAGDIDRIMDGVTVKADEAARPAAQAGAQVLYDAARANAARIKDTGGLAQAIYQVFSQRLSNDSKAVYHIAVNRKKAGFAHNVEFGHVERFAHYRDEQGRIRMRVRPEAKGKPRPMRGKANRAALDAYYVLLPTPVHVPAKPFLRPAFAAHMDEARAAMVKEFEKRVLES